jgi:ParB-like chromosome segregation protein Spo0J
VTTEVRDLPIDLIEVEQDFNRRTSFEITAIEELSKSIAERGVLLPITVARRERSTFSSPVSDASVPPTAWSRRSRDRPERPFGRRRRAPGRRAIENLQRQDITIGEEIHAYRRLKDDHGWNAKRIAHQLGLPHARVTRRMALLELPDDALDSVAKFSDPARKALVAIAKDRWIQAKTSADAHVQVVVVVDQRHHHAGGSGEPRVRAHEHGLRARGHEAVDEFLGERRIDLGGVAGGPFLAVRARIVDVHVEAVLVAGVADVAELRAEVASLRAAEVAHRHPRGARMRAPVFASHAQDGADQTTRAVAAPGTIGRPALDRVPGEEVLPLPREPNAAQEPAGRRVADRHRAFPLDARVEDPPLGGDEITPAARAEGKRGRQSGCKKGGAEHGTKADQGVLRADDRMSTKPRRAQVPPDS